MNPSPLQAAASASASAGSNPSFAKQRSAYRGSLSAGRFATWAVVLLTAAMFTNSAIGIFGANRALMLVIEYVVWLIAALIIRVHLRTAGQIIRFRTPIRAGIIAFLAGLTLSTICIWLAGSRSDFGHLLPQVAALVYMTLPFFVFDAATKTTNVEWPVLLACHVIVALCMVSILGDVSGFTDFEHGGGRYFGFLSDGVAWALTLPFVIYFSSNRLAPAAVAGLGLALTGSRAPAICTAGALLLLIAFSRGRRTRYSITLAALLALAAYESNIFQTLASRIGATSIGANDRLGTAFLGIRIFKGSPYFGMGYNSFGYFFSRRFTSSMHNVLFAQTSTFVQMLSDGGLILFLGYLAFTIAAAVGGIALMNRSKTVADSGVINGVAAWLTVMLWVNQSATWFVVGSYFGPIVFGMTGIVSGYNARLVLVRAQERAHASHR